jgi:hypothetical protein
MLVSGCLFEDCNLGIFANSGTYPYASPFRAEIVDSRFERCTTRAINVFDYQSGVWVTNCWFQDNTVQYGGGAMSLSGTRPAVRVISDCVFWNNHTTAPGSSGGAIFLGYGGTVSGCTFFENGGGHPQVAGTIRCDTGTFQFWNNVFAGTTQGVALQGVNAAVLTGGCNVFWDNPDGEAIGYTLAATDRIIDPQFCGADTGNFTVTTLSPCLPEHSQGCGQIGARGWGCEPISIDPMSWGEIKAGYRREPNEGVKP